MCIRDRLWGGRFEVVVATHCNTGHYHNHFVINSVSWVDGKKFYNSPADYARMREVSDRLCREYAISVIENPGRQTKDYAEWRAERDGKPTHRGTIRADIDRAIRASTTERDFLRVLDEMGYQLSLIHICTPRTFFPNPGWSLMKSTSIHLSLIHIWAGNRLPAH